MRFLRAALLVCLGVWLPVAVAADTLDLSTFKNAFSTYDPPVYIYIDPADAGGFAIRSARYDRDPVTKTWFYCVNFVDDGPKTANDVRIGYFYFDYDYGTKTWHQIGFDILDRQGTFSTGQLIKGGVGILAHLRDNCVSVDYYDARRFKAVVMAVVGITYTDGTSYDRGLDFGPIALPPAQPKYTPAPWNG